MNEISKLIAEISRMEEEYSMQNSCVDSGNLFYLVGRCKAQLQQFQQAGEVEIPENENYVIIPVGYHRLKHIEGYYTGWTQEVRKCGDKAIITVSETYESGPHYQPPQRHRFAVNCLIPEPKSNDVAELVKRIEKCRTSDSLKTSSEIAAEILALTQNSFIAYKQESAQKDNDLIDEMEKAASQPDKGIEELKEQLYQAEGERDIYKGRSEFYEKSIDSSIDCQHLKNLNEEVQRYREALEKIQGKTSWGTALPEYKRVKEVNEIAEQALSPIANDKGGE